MTDLSAPDGQLSLDALRWHGLTPTHERNPAMTETVTYDPDQDNCRGGCSRNDDRRVAFPFYGEIHFACPGCFEEVLGGPPGPDDVIVTVD